MLCAGTKWEFARSGGGCWGGGHPSPPHSETVSFSSGPCECCMCACMLSCFSRVQFLATPWTIAHQAPLSLGFSRQEYWSGLPCPPLGDLPNPGIKPTSPALQADSLPLCHQESPSGQWWAPHGGEAHLVEHCQACTSPLWALHAHWEHPAWGIQRDWRWEVLTE